jgi:hypothetical protein
MHIALKKIKYKAALKYLSSLEQQLSLTDSKICLFASSCFFVYYNMNQGVLFWIWYYPSDISFVAYKVLLLIFLIIQFKAIQIYYFFKKSS